MSFEEIKAQAIKLESNERLDLINTLSQSLNCKPQDEVWQFLESRPHPWRKQLYLKGRRLLASSVWSGMIANQLTLEQAVDNWDLPLAAIGEAIQYCETHRDLLEREAEAERQYLQSEGISLEPTTVTG
jgi:predicted anti-sigma-YlaC factor YlaD